MVTSFGALDLKCVNTVRVLSADVVQRANSGHPGAPMGCAPIAHVLWSRVMNYDPADPHWPNRDRFVLSNGHACALQYSMLHLCGYDVTLADLQAFRQAGSRTPGHPEVHVTPGIEVTTGPLGQGLANAVGLAIAQKHLAAHYHRDGAPSLFDSYTFVLVGDGCLQEGVASEAASLAGHLGLGHLIVLYDDNSITIDGETELSFTENVVKRFESYGWQTLSVADGDNDLAGILRAIDEAKSDTERPTLIKVKTTIGFGSAKQGTEKVHGAPLGADDLKAVKQRLLGGDGSESFVVADDVRAAYHARAAEGRKRHEAWRAQLDAFAAAHPAEGAEIKRRFFGAGGAGVPALPLPHDELVAKLPAYTPQQAALATRQLGQKAINALALLSPDMVGGSADLNPSCFTYMDCSGDFQARTPAGRNIRFGVREHAMAAICNGLAAFGGIRAYCSTFLNFIEYAFPSVRLSALSNLPVVYIMTHDSIGLGEDGPTHQPVEALAMCRATPNLHVWRPADGNETNAAYVAAFSSTHTPSVLALSRQATPNLAGTSVQLTLKGGYVLQAETAPLSVILVGTGTETALAVKAAAALGAGARVVSMPCLEVFHQQSAEYQNSVLPAGVPIVLVEALASQSWTGVAHAIVGLDRFGMSGKAPEVYTKLGITAAAVEEKAKQLMQRFPAGSAPATYDQVQRALSA